MVTPLAESVDQPPVGAKIRRWTLRDDKGSHHHGVVSLSESPLYLELRWRRSASDSVRRVGTFRLQLGELLKQGYVRSEPVGSNSSEVRLRIVRAADSEFYVQANLAGPALRLIGKGNA